MKNMHFYRRTLAGVIMASALFVLGACNRPENAMVAAFQKQSDAIYHAKASLVSKMYAQSGGNRALRGFTGGLNFASLGFGYTPHNPFGDATFCRNRVGALQALPLESLDRETLKAIYWQVAGHAIRCGERMLTGTTNSVFGGAFPFMAPQGQAFMRYMTDFRNVSGQFVGVPYGFSYRWGNGFNPTQHEDPNGFFNLLTGHPFGNFSPFPG